MTCLVLFTRANLSVFWRRAYRLSSELMSLMMSCPAGISAFPADDSDLTFWKGRIEGADVSNSEETRDSTCHQKNAVNPLLTKHADVRSFPKATYYEGHVYAISLQFPPSYPYTAPTVRFETTCYHPNVDLHGNICLDILKEKWSPMLSVSTILISLQSLLGEPNNASPLNVEAADLWDNAEGVSCSWRLKYGCWTRGSHD